MILVLIALVGGGLLVQNRIDSMNQNFSTETNNTIQVSPTPKIIKPTPTPSPTTRPTSKPTNPQINCTGPDGVVFKTTQEKCDEFNNAWGGAKNTETQQNYQQSAPTVPKIENNNSQKQPPCTVGNITYDYVDPATCSRYQARWQETQDWIKSTKYTEPSSDYANTNEPQVQDNFALQGECIDKVVIQYNKSIQTANVRYGGGNSLGDLMKELAEKDYTKNTAACKSAYPT